MIGIMVASATAVVKRVGKSDALERAPGPTVVGTGSPVYTGLGPSLVRVFDSSPSGEAPGRRGVTLPVVIADMVVVANRTCSAGATKLAGVPASAGGVTPGESFANYVVYSVYSTSAISTGVRPVVGTPGTTRGPM